jgi:predicted metal-dependent phosphoesterase TrpH
MTMPGYATYDLHLHTYWSYDACAPVEYHFRRARELKLRRIAVTEHFTMDSLPEVLDCSRRYPDVAFIPGAELTVRTPQGYSVDLVCLGMPTEHPPELRAVFEVYRKYCVERGLLSSAGSDCHADPADNPHGIGLRHEFARHIGEDRWLDEILERLPQP